MKSKSNNSAKHRSISQWLVFGLSACALSVSIGCDDDDAVFSLMSSSETPPSTPNDDDKTASPGGSFDQAPVLRTQLDMNDAALAEQALTIMRGDGKSKGWCSECHAIGRPNLSLWSFRTRAFSDECLSQPILESQEDVNSIYKCMYEYMETNLLDSAEAFGIYSAAARLPWFTFLDENADLVKEGPEESNFITDGVMPPLGERMSQEEFDVVAEWFERGLPGMSDLLPAEGGQECVNALNPDLSSELAELAISGWRAKNEEVPLVMLGCGPGEIGRGCLSEFPDAAETELGQGWAEALSGATNRILYDNSSGLPTSFWSRSSADGRYIASGVAVDSDFPGQFIDLVTSERISGNFSFDPTFYPDNSAILLQGGELERDNRVQPSDESMVCSQNVLDGRFEVISEELDQCTRIGEIGLYQQVATSLDGSDYWAVEGLFESDEPGFLFHNRQPAARFGGEASITFTRVNNLGDRFAMGDSYDVATSFQGDAIVSPSGRLLVTRLQGPEYFSENAFGRFPGITADQSGYQLYRVVTEMTKDTPSVQLEDMGQICLQGAKANFSFDERWIVFHRYISPDEAVELGFKGPEDPGFAEYLSHAGANIYLVDLLSGASHRVTNMAPGQYALFPHFRSDGWVYYVARTLEGRELFVATDAALLLEEEAQ
ncbi:MAG: hypothetical protein KTR25_12980 [Myxococcales bacterium]|nr:hypothetical protein [Myxococcales bacterium]